MHELSLAVNIIEIAEAEAASAGASVVHEVIIEAGAVSGVDCGILQGALEFASKDTSLESAKFTIKTVPGKGICSKCGTGFVMSDIFTPCPVCGSPAGKLTEGTELKVVTITAD